MTTETLKKATHTQVIPTNGRKLGKYGRISIPKKFLEANGIPLVGSDVEITMAYLEGEPRPVIVFSFPPT